MRSPADTHDTSSQIHNKKDEVQADMRRCYASAVGFSPSEWPRGLACTVARRAPVGQVAHRPTTSKQQALIARASQARVDRSCQLPVKLSRSQSGNNTRPSTGAAQILAVRRMPERSELPTTPVGFHPVKAVFGRMRTKMPIRIHRHTSARPSSGRKVSVRRALEPEGTARRVRGNRGPEGGVMRASRPTRERSAAGTDVIGLGL